MLQGELDDHLGYETHAPERRGSGNSRNGYSSKKVKSESLGDVVLSIPRDRNSSFEPKLIPKHQRMSEQIEQSIIGMYSRGMSTRDIEDQVREMYGVEVSESTVSTVTSRVIDHITESASFWLSVLTDLKARGVEDILIACTDNLTGFTKAIAEVFPKTITQLCVVHQIRNSCKYVSWKERKEFSADLKQIYGAVNKDAAQQALETFSRKWGSKYGYAIASWENNWEALTSYFDFPMEIRKIIYTTNVIESLNSGIRKFTKAKNLFPDD